MPRALVARTSCSYWCEKLPHGEKLSQSALGDDETAVQIPVLGITELRQSTELSVSKHQHKGVPPTSERMRQVWESYHDKRINFSPYR